MVLDDAPEFRRVIVIVDIPVNDACIVKDILGVYIYFAVGVIITFDPKLRRNG